MATFDADELGKRLEEINRDELATIERVTDELLQTLQRRDPLRTDTDEPRLRRQSPPVPAQNEVRAAAAVRNRSRR